MSGGPGRYLVGVLAGVGVTPVGLWALGRSLEAYLERSGAGGSLPGVVELFWVAVGAALLAVVVLVGLASASAPFSGGLVWGVVPGVLGAVSPRTLADLYRGVPYGEPGLMLQDTVLLGLPVGVALCAAAAAAVVGTGLRLPRSGGVGLPLHIVWAAFSLAAVPAALLTMAWAQARLLPALERLDPRSPLTDDLAPWLWLGAGAGMLLVVLAVGGRWWMGPLVAGLLTGALGLLLTSTDMGVRLRELVSGYDVLREAWVTLSPPLLVGLGAVLGSAGLASLLRPGARRS